VNEINADFAVDINRSADDAKSESSLMEVFFAEFIRLKRIIAGMGLNISDAEDVLQNVSIRAFRQNVEIKGRQNQIRWVIKVTVNECLMEHRRRKSFQKNVGNILKNRLETKAASKTTDEIVIVAEELEIVRVCLRKLDDSLLVPLVLQYFCDLNSVEIGRILDSNPSTVRSRIRDARMILAKELIERGIEA
jgi:RNA polymerase sigma factor (sigma-70 family)